MKIDLVLISNKDFNVLSKRNLSVLECECWSSFIGWEILALIGNGLGAKFKWNLSCQVECGVLCSPTIYKIELMHNRMNPGKRWAYIPKLGKTVLDFLCGPDLAWSRALDFILCWAFGIGKLWGFHVKGLIYPLAIMGPWSNIMYGNIHSAGTKGVSSVFLSAWRWSGGVILGRLLLLSCCSASCCTACSAWECNSFRFVLRSWKLSAMRFPADASNAFGSTSSASLVMAESSFVSKPTVVWHAERLDLAVAKFSIAVCKRSVRVFSCSMNWEEYFCHCCTEAARKLRHAICMLKRACCASSTSFFARPCWVTAVWSNLVSSWPVRTDTSFMRSWTSSGRSSLCLRSAAKRDLYCLSLSLSSLGSAVPILADVAEVGPGLGTEFNQGGSKAASDCAEGGPNWGSSSAGPLDLPLPLPFAGVGFRFLDLGLGDCRRRGEAYCLVSSHCWSSVQGWEYVHCTWRGFCCLFGCTKLGSAQICHPCPHWPQYSCRPLHILLHVVHFHGSGVRESMSALILFKKAVSFEWCLCRICWILFNLQRGKGWICLRCRYQANRAWDRCLRAARLWVGVAVAIQAIINCHWASCHEVKCQSDGNVKYCNHCQNWAHSRMSQWKKNRSGELTPNWWAVDGKSEKGRQCQIPETQVAPATNAKIWNPPQKNQCECKPL